MTIAAHTDAPAAPKRGVIVRVVAEATSFPRRRPILFVFGVLLGFLVIWVMMVAGRTFVIWHLAAKPAPVAGPTYPEVQTQSFTCGMHAIHSVYRAYGLDPDYEQIRYRLGVDTKAIFWLHDSTGALHPDIYMVLEQDGFDIRSIPLGRPDSHDAILAHLASGQMVLLLIKRRENGNMHWVAAGAGEGTAGAKPTAASTYQVYDSLLPAPYPETRDFTDQHILTALALTPSGELRTGALASIGHLIAGTLELRAFHARSAQLNAN